MTTWRIFRQRKATLSEPVGFERPDPDTKFFKTVSEAKRYALDYIADELVVIRNNHTGDYERFDPQIRQWVRGQENR